MFAILKRSLKEFIDDDCTGMAAALSYYTIFSLPPLLLLLLLLVGAVMDPQDVRGALETQLQQLMGPAAGAQVRAIITHAESPAAGARSRPSSVSWRSCSARPARSDSCRARSTAPGRLPPHPKQGGIRSFLLKRLFSFGMVLVIAFFCSSFRSW